MKNPVINNDKETSIIKDDTTFKPLKPQDMLKIKGGTSVIVEDVIMF